MFSFLNKYEIYEYKYDKSENSFINERGKVLDSFKLAKEIKEENKKINYSILDKLSIYLNKKDPINFSNFIKELDMRVFEISLNTSDEIFITLKYEKKNSIFVCYLSKNIYSNKSNFVKFLQEYKRYASEVLGKTQIMIEISEFFKIDESDILKNNFSPALFYFEKKVKPRREYIQSNIYKIELNKSSNKLKYNRKTKYEVQFSRLKKLYRDFLIEENDVDICNLTDKKERYTDKDITNTLMDYITGRRNKNIDYNIFVYLEPETENIIGFSFAHFDKNEKEEKVGHISTLYVDPKYRKTGVSSALFDAHETFFYNNGIHKISICTLGENDKARRIYENHFDFKLVRTLYCFNI